MLAGHASRILKTSKEHFEECFRNLEVDPSFHFFARVATEVLEGLLADNTPHSAATGLARRRLAIFEANPSRQALMAAVGDASRVPPLGHVDGEHKLPRPTTLPTDAGLPGQL
jgi:hypothetical protein